MGAVAIGVALAGCNDEDPTAVWTLFSSGDDALEVQIADTVGPAVVVPLTSSTGGTTVGQVTIDPGSGPVGTEHRVVVEVDDAYEERVERVDLYADAGERGVQSFALVQDSADLGYWVVDLTTQGVEGEERTDRLRVELWELRDVLPGADDG